MNELNDRLQNAEAQATESERQAQATQHELARSQAGVKGEEKGAAVPLQQEQGIGAFASKYQPQPFKGEDDKWREWARVFRSWSGRVFGGALAEIYEHVEGHRNDSATIVDLALTSLRFGAGLLRNISTELCHVLIMLTRGRAPRWVLKAAEPEGLEANRSLLQRYEPISTVTTFSKLVDLLATTFSGDFMEKRRVASWEHDAKETLSDLINIGVVIKVWRKVVCGIICSSKLLARQNG